MPGSSAGHELMRRFTSRTRQLVRIKPKYGLPAVKCRGLWLVQGGHVPLARTCPKCRGRAQGKPKRTRKARRLDKEPKSPNQSGSRARALLYLMRKFLLVARPRDPNGAPAPSCFVTPKTRTPRARAATTELT
ncbi:hypothetical protein PIB30_069446 [Stylosanthes scabra]|uniref:Uncharacterized protein n=1 Tax=Stylosanthes scabra TaxID=79078 RepID=A0ABU6ZLY2_9FABA|nr:hypothetical protein [Stylosanthes scabra]